MPILKETWQTPLYMTNESLWVARDSFNLDYYLVGRWRLTYGLDFATQMGYRYHLQLDDDTMVNSKLEENIVAKMSASGYKLSVPYQVVAF